MLKRFDLSEKGDNFTVVYAAVSNIVIAIPITASFLNCYKVISAHCIFPPRGRTIVAAIVLQLL